MAEVKFCGLTRPDDARCAAELGAAYLGVVFAGGPRKLDARTARAVLDGASGVGHARRVGVFGAQSAAEIARVAHDARLDVLQLHGASSTAMVDQLRGLFDGQVWRVVRVRGADVESALLGAANGVDALVVDALVDGALGGTGVSVDWEQLAAALQRIPRPARLILAGGLRPDNVSAAIALVAPDVVDVSSGVESSVGIKDESLMRAFALAAARGGR